LRQKTFYLVALILMVSCSQVLAFDSFVIVKPLLASGKIIPNKTFKMIIIIGSNSNNPQTLLLKVHLEGAEFVLKNSRTSNTMLIFAKVSKGKKIIKEFTVKAKSSIIRVNYMYNGVWGKGIIGEVEYPCTFVEVRTEPRAFIGSYAVEEYNRGFVTIMHLNKLRFQKLELRLYNSCGVKKVPIAIEFPNAKPSQSVVVYRCSQEIVERHQADVCTSWACALKDRTGRLRCVKRAKIPIPRCECVKVVDGKCAGYRVVYEKVKRCLRLVSESKCLEYKCAKWEKVTYTLKYCDWMSSSILRSNIKVRGREASFTLNDTESVIAVYYNPNKYYYGLTASSIVNAPLVTIYVGGTPYYVIEGALESANYHSSIMALLASLFMFVVALMYFYFT